MSRPTYTIVARRSGDWWALEVPELERVFSQTRRLDQAPFAIQEVLEGVHDIAPGTYDLMLTADLAGLNEFIERAKQTSKEAQAAAAKAREAQQSAIAQLREFGLPQRDVGEILGLSHQRVAQIANASGGHMRVRGNPLTVKPIKGSGATTVSKKSSSGKPVSTKSPAMSKPGRASSKTRE
jgi:predicted RNase H-like HicB family nuclease